MNTEIHGVGEEVRIATGDEHLPAREVTNK